MSDAPILFECLDDGAMVPASPYWAKRAAETFPPGGKYFVVRHEERSMKTHNHFFACLHETFVNLPDELRDTYPSEDHLRKKLLIRAGYCQERDIVCTSKAEALRVVSIVKSLDTYAVVMPIGNVVKIYTAESQSYRSMGKARFAESKEKLLDMLSSLVGVTSSQLSKHGETA